MSTRSSAVEHAFARAKDQYAEWSVDVERALEKLSTVSISLHCWQGDDVRGFENSGEDLGGGLAVTGNYAGKARNGDELRADLDEALVLVPGSHRVNLHASYAETAARRSSATSSSRNTLAAGSIGPNPGGSAWTSTRRTSRTRWRQRV